MQLFRVIKREVYYAVAENEEEAAAIYAPTDSVMAVKVVKNIPKVTDAVAKDKTGQTVKVSDCRGLVGKRNPSAD